MSRLSCVMIRTAHPRFLYLSCFFSCRSCLPARAQKSYPFDFNAECRKAYDEIIQLKLNTGKQILKAEKKAHPDNLIPYFLDNYIDFFTLFFNQDPEEFKRKKPAA